MILKKHSDSVGATIVEASISACTAVFFLATLFTMNMSAMQAVRTARQATSASQVLQQRVETLRIANWQQVTNPAWLRDNLLNQEASGSEGLPLLSESLILVPYNSMATGSTTIVRTAGSTQIQSQAQLLTEHAVKVIWRVVYSTGPKTQPTTRETVAILAKGGVAKW